MTIIPNRHPTIPDPSGRRLAVVGEAPGADEESVREPFVGASGRLLRLLLSHAGINPDSCLLANICQQRPPLNDISSFSWDGPEIQAGIEVLRQDLSTFRPNCILSLGRTPFRFFNPSRCYPVRPTLENPDGIRIPLSDWRGSPFVSPDGYKIIPSFHPAYILRTFSDVAYLRADLGRAVRHSSDPTLRLLERTGILRPSFSEVLTFLSNLRSTRQLAAFDIEGYSDHIGVTMLSIAPSATSGIVVPFFVDGKNYWTEEEEAIVWAALAGWLADEACPKIAHNAFYETAVLGWRHKCVINNLCADTMMKHWEIYNELEKSLGVCTSFWIEEPFYKDERESSGDKKLNYNFKDSACTYGINEAMEPVLNRLDGPKRHYDFNVSLIPAYTYMHLRGCRFDSGRAKAHLLKAHGELDILNSRIESAVGEDLVAAGYDGPFNVKSADHKTWFLYDHLNLEPYKRYGRTSKEEILHRFYKKTGNETLKTIIQAVSLRTRISDIEKLTPHNDGRIRTSYGLVATTTARLNSQESSITELVGYVKSGPRKGQPVHGDFGTNLQNVTKPIRDTFIPDSDDFLFFQADLEGADAWTVACDLAACGNNTMLKDLQARIKPAKVLLTMLEAKANGRDPAVIARMDQAELKTVVDSIVVPEGTLPDGRPADWLYTCLKKCSHATNYLGQPETINGTIFKDSDGIIDVPPTTIGLWQSLYFLRYPVELRKRHIIQRLSVDGCIQTAAGCKRRFFGIRNPRNISDDEELIRQAMASEPQTNTTYCTNLALKRLWYDPANRRKSGALFVEPLLQIHDALAGQFPVRLRDFAREKLREWFSNPITINGITITIPVDIKVGNSWYGCKTPI